MEQKKSLGILLIALGTIFLLLQVGDSFNLLNFRLFRSWQLWPLTIIGLGFIFDYLYYTTKKNPGFLVPGGILMTIGFLHLFETITNWYFAAYTWPVYVLAFAFGFYHYHFVTKERWAFIVALVFGCIGGFQSLIVFAVFFGNIFSSRIIVAAVIILIGLLLLFKPGHKTATN